MDALALETTEEIFSDGIVVETALAGYALAETKFREAVSEDVCSILDTAVRMGNKVVVFGPQEESVQG